MAKADQDGIVDIKIGTNRVKVATKYLLVAASVLGLTSGGTYMGTHFGKAPATVASTDPKSVRPLVESGPVIARLHDDDARQQMSIDGLFERQRADHDMVIKLQSDVEHIKENTDKAVQLLEQHVSRPPPNP